MRIIIAEMQISTPNKLISTINIYFFIIASNIINRTVLIAQICIIIFPNRFTEFSLFIASGMGIKNNARLKETRITVVPKEQLNTSRTVPIINKNARKTERDFITNLVIFCINKVIF
jgi:hypothetical protein